MLGTAPVTMHSCQDRELEAASGARLQLDLIEIFSEFCPKRVPERITTFNKTQLLLRFFIELRPQDQSRRSWFRVTLRFQNGIAKNLPSANRAISTFAKTKNNQCQDGD